MEIKAAAKKFREYWNSRSGYEKGEDQQFWNSLLRDVLGAEDIESSIKYQVPVKLKNTTKFLKLIPKSLKFPFRQGALSPSSTMRF